MIYKYLPKTMKIREGKHDTKKTEKYKKNLKCYFSEKSLLTNMLQVVYWANKNKYVRKFVTQGLPFQIPSTFTSHQTTTSSSSSLRYLIISNYLIKVCF